MILVTDTGVTDAVRTEAHRFRQALDSAHAAGEFTGHPALASFPLGTCGIVSAFMCQYLRDRGLGGDWQNISAERHSPTTGQWQGTHAWVRRGRVVIDLTADQFAGEGRPPVWVGEADAWYRSWEETGPNLNEVDETGVYYAAYKTVLRYVRSNGVHPG